jgi:hypothetical protein
MAYEYLIMPINVDPNRKQQLEEVLNTQAKNGFRVAHVIQKELHTWLLLEKQIDA